MTPQDSSVRLRELGSSLAATDFPNVEELHITEEAIPVIFAKMIASMLPGTVTLVGLQMTTSDIPAMLHFPHLVSICAHRLAFAPLLLAQHRMFPELQSIAMSHTSLSDSDFLTLSDRTGITSLHFAATQLTDDALACFGTLPDLELLDIRETRVTDKGLRHLTTLRNLFTIDARGTSVSANGACSYREHVSKWLPDVEVLL